MQYALLPALYTAYLITHRKVAPELRPLVFRIMKRSRGRANLKSGSCTYSILPAMYTYIIYMYMYIHCTYSYTCTLAEQCTCTYTWTQRGQSTLAHALYTYAPLMSHVICPFRRNQTGNLIYCKSCKKIAETNKKFCEIIL